MATRRSLKLVLAVLVAGLGAGATFAWAGVLIGGHRADNIGTFEPASANAFAPVDPAGPLSVSTTISAPPRTTVGTSTPGSPSTSVGTSTPGSPRTSVGTSTSESTSTSEWTSTSESTSTSVATSTSDDDHQPPVDDD